jgi:CRISPR/Cas system-associated endonuclease Cas3-HD
LTSRWVDPFFKSYGVGFMRADNFRYEVKAEQVITSKIKLTTLFRKEQDNLLSMYNYTTNLTTIGANLSIKISRNLTVRAGYNPVLQAVTTKDNSYSLNNRNNISNFVVTYNPHLKKINTSFNALYSYYNLTSAIQTNVFESINVNNTTMLKSGFRFLSSATWFHSSVLDTNGNNTLLIVEEVGYSF